jgi:uncharacterized protein (TIGR00266 family)
MDYVLQGEVIQTVQITLQKGEAVFSESGGMAWMTDGIEMKSGTRGGLGKMLGRALSGESLFQTTFTASHDGAVVTFAQAALGKIMPLQLEAGHSMILQRDAFLCAQEGVTHEMHFRKKLGTGLFGGEGFIMQKVTGPGVVFVELTGEVIDYTLKAGQRLKIDPGHIAMYEPSVGYDLTTVKGIKNFVFGGEGLFLATLTGPGRVWLQTMPIQNLASRIYQIMPPLSSSSGSDSIEGQVLGGLGKILGGN